MVIRAKTDRKPGGRSSRFAEMLDPEKAMATGSTKQEITQEDAVVNDRAVVVKKVLSEKSNFKNGQPLRVDKGIWLRLKSLQLKREKAGQRTTLMELANEALDVFLTAQGE